MNIVKKFINGVIYLFTHLAVSIILWLFLLLLVFFTFDLTWNTSSSLPLGVYRKVDKGITEIQKGDIVLFCLEGERALLSKERGYVSTSLFSYCPHKLIPLMKPVVGLPKDKIFSNENGIYVNGELLLNSKPLVKDSKSRLMPMAKLPAEVPENHFLLISSYNPASWDSRYYGFISTDAVHGVVRPIITFTFYWGF